MHPDVARIVLAQCAAGSTVLDPFCGSGTVLIEALAAGCAPTGVDLNPLALRLADVCTSVRGAPERERFARVVDAITEASLERVRARTKVRAPLPPHERAFYEPHVLLELAGLFEEIQRADKPRDRLALEMIFSSLLVKFSKQASDTSERMVDKRLRKGLVSEFFARKGRELVQRWAALAEAVPRPPPPVRLRQGDARKLPAVLGQRARFDLVLSSPPYGGTYDYVVHHARRYRWLGIDPSQFERREVGARRHLSQGEGAEARWERELLACLRAIAAVTNRRRGRIVLLMGDAELGRRRVDAAEQLVRLSPRANLRLRASVAQRRSDPRGARARLEHLVMLAPD
jgi:16S rRNA G966 N2-methylase RsmD